MAQGLGVLLRVHAHFFGAAASWGVQFAMLRGGSSYILAVDSRVVYERELGS